METKGKEEEAAVLERVWAKVGRTRATSSDPSFADLRSPLSFLAATTYLFDCCCSDLATTARRHLTVLGRADWTRFGTRGESARRRRRAGLACEVLRRSRIGAECGGSEGGFRFRHALAVKYLMKGNPQGLIPPDSLAGAAAFRALRLHPTHSPLSTSALRTLVESVVSESSKLVDRYSDKVGFALAPAFL